jgi:hypothetical protein
VNLCFFLNVPLDPERLEWAIQNASATTQALNRKPKQNPQIPYVQEFPQRAAFLGQVLRDNEMSMSHLEKKLPYSVS